MAQSLLHHLITAHADDVSERVAIRHHDTTRSYAALKDDVQRVAGGLKPFVKEGDRVAVYLPKCCEAVVASLAISAVGAVLVPINPVLKPAQVGHILKDSGAALLVSHGARLKSLRVAERFAIQCISIDTESAEVLPWSAIAAAEPVAEVGRQPDDLAALLYTSGSTGLPKGVMLSHRNLLLGAKSVASYLGMRSDDKILAVLPFSFDYGFNQLLSSLYCGAECVLLDYLFPKDIVNACERFSITGLAGVPPLWTQLTAVQWPSEAAAQLRFFTNSGGHMGQELLQKVQQRLPHAEPILMYGLTEAFRSSYVPSKDVARKPGSMGIAIPGAELYVLRPDGSLCEAGEKGELVHAGDLVAKGYWGKPEKTAERFKALPALINAARPPAVWSGDTVFRDEDGFLYFCGRNDNQIKVSGYRISPEEIEAVLQGHNAISHAVVFGVPDEANGQSIVAVVQADEGAVSPQDCMRHCRQQLAAYMVPATFVIKASLPTNANGKLDRSRITEQYSCAMHA